MTITKEVTNRIEDVINQRLKAYTSSQPDIRSDLEGYLGEGNVNFIYPLNLFEFEDPIKHFYVFHKGFISEVTYNLEIIEIVTRPFEVELIKYSPPSEQQETECAMLYIKIDENYSLNFNSLADSHDYVRESFKKMIHEIYTYSLTS